MTVFRGEAAIKEFVDAFDGWVSASVSAYSWAGPR